MTWMLSRDKNLVVVLCPNEPNEPTTRMSNEDTGARGPDRADSRIFMAVNESVTRRRQCCEWEEQEDVDDVGEKDIIIIISCFPPPQLLYWYGMVWVMFVVCGTSTLKLMGVVFFSNHYITLLALSVSCHLDLTESLLIHGMFNRKENQKDSNGQARLEVK